MLPETPLFTGLDPDKHLVIEEAEAPHQPPSAGCPVMSWPVTGAGANACHPSWYCCAYIQWQRAQMRLYVT